MANPSHADFSDGIFWCPEGGDFLVCKTGTRFVGCCNGLNACEHGCFDENLLPAAIRGEFVGEIPGVSCGGSVSFWSGSEKESSFYGCCDSDPFQNVPPVCPRKDLYPAFWDRPDQFYFFPKNVQNATPVVTSPIVLATSLLTYTKLTVDVQVVARSAATASTTIAMAFTGTVCIALAMWLCWRHLWDRYGRYGAYTER
jgi:hypothetical protein